MHWQWKRFVLYKCPTWDNVLIFKVTCLGHVMVIVIHKKTFMTMGITFFIYLFYCTLQRPMYFVVLLKGGCTHFWFAYNWKRNCYCCAYVLTCKISYMLIFFLFANSLFKSSHCFQLQLHQHEHPLTNVNNINKLCKFLILNCHGNHPPW